jgi:uncharacterized protein (TIGR03083 family)
VPDYLAALGADSARFLDILRAGDLDGAVPSCPDWRLADLGWHLTEVQSFWAEIVEGLLDDPEQATQPDRPHDGSLANVFAEESTRLQAALAARSPEDRCWSWHDGGQSVGWVRRRQAHEALIHRVDAELAAGERTPVDPRLANDGVDEIISVMLTGVPGWGTFTPDGTTAVVETIDHPGSWSLQLGRFTGTSPRSGNDYDLAAAELLPHRPAEPGAVLRGTSADLDLWLWGRGTADAVAVAGDETMVERLRALAAESTQ